MLKWFSGLFTSNARTLSQEAGKIRNDNLRNVGVVGSLKQQFGIDVGNVARLNKILEKMGIIEKNANGWQLTDYGRRKYTGFNVNAYRPNWWHSSIVKDVADYIKNNNIDLSKIKRKS